MTHTPGPWGVDSSMISTGWVLVTKSNGDVVANVNTETGPDIPPAVSIKMPALSNAHLIAAAPDMLEALEIAKWIIEKNIHGPVAGYSNIEAAIQEARGEE